MQYLTDEVQILHKRHVFNITFPSMPMPSLQFFHLQFCIYLSYKYTLFRLTTHFLFLQRYTFRSKLITRSYLQNFKSKVSVDGVIKFLVTRNSVYVTD